MAITFSWLTHATLGRIIHSLKVLFDEIKAIESASHRGDLEHGCFCAFPLQKHAWVIDPDKLHISSLTLQNVFRSWITSLKETIRKKYVSGHVRKPLLTTRSGLDFSLSLIGLKLQHCLLRGHLVCALTATCAQKVSWISGILG